jgi:hypothetical protein
MRLSKHGDSVARSSAPRFPDVQGIAINRKAGRQKVLFVHRSAVVAAERCRAIQAGF